MWRALAILGAALNIADAVVTCILIERCIATEGNPLMALIYAFGVPAFYAVKSIVCALFLFLGTRPDNLIAKVGIVLGLISYFGVLAYDAAALTLCA